MKSMHGRARRALSFALLWISLLLALLPVPIGTPSAAAGGCPEVKSGAPGSEGFVVDTFYDAFFCVVPLRNGTLDPPDRWGYRHILARCEDPAFKNHCLDEKARARTTEAIAWPSLKCPEPSGVRSYYLNFVEGTWKRHQRVIVDFDDFKGLGPRGIRTSYWGRGHKTSCPPR